MITAIYLTGNALIVLGVFLTLGVGPAIIAAGAVVVAHARWKAS